jgi:ABC-2 type transport system ATP-binding protein
VLEREGTLAELVADQPSRISFVAPPGVELPITVTRTDNGLSIVDSSDLQRDLTILLAWADRAGHRLDLLSASTSNLDDLFRSLGR